MFGQNMLNTRDSMRGGTNERTYTTTKHITTLLLRSRVKILKRNLTHHWCKVLKEYTLFRSKFSNFTHLVCRVPVWHSAECRVPSQHFGTSHHWCVKFLCTIFPFWGRKYRFGIFGRREAKTCKKSWKKILRTTGAKFRCADVPGWHSVECRVPPWHFGTLHQWCVKFVCNIFYPFWPPYEYFRPRCDQMVLLTRV